MLKDNSQQPDCPGVSPGSLLVVRWGHEPSCGAKVRIILDMTKEKAEILQSEGCGQGEGERFAGEGMGKGEGVGVEVEAVGGLSVEAVAAYGHA